METLLIVVCFVLVLRALFWARLPPIWAIGLAVVVTLVIYQSIMQLIIGLMFPGSYEAIVLPAMATIFVVGALAIGYMMGHKRSLG